MADTRYGVNRLTGELGFKEGQQQKRTGSSLYWRTAAEAHWCPAPTGIRTVNIRPGYSSRFRLRYARTSGLSGGIRVKGGFRAGHTDGRFKGSFYSSFISDKRGLLQA